MYFFASRLLNPGLPVNLWRYVRNFGQQRLPFHPCSPWTFVFAKQLMWIFCFLLKGNSSLGLSGQYLSLPVSSIPVVSYGDNQEISMSENQTAAGMYHGWKGTFLPLHVPRFPILTRTHKQIWLCGCHLVIVAVIRAGPWTLVSISTAGKNQYVYVQ